MRDFDEAIRYFRKALRREKNQLPQISKTSELNTHLLDNEFNFMKDGSSIDGKIIFSSDETFTLNDV